MSGVPSVGVILAQTDAPPYVVWEGAPIDHNTGARAVPRIEVTTEARDKHAGDGWHVRKVFRETESVREIAGVPLPTSIAGGRSFEAPEQAVVFAVGSLPDGPHYQEQVL